MMSLEFLPQFPLSANPLALFGVLLLAGALAGEPTRCVLNVPRITGYVLGAVAFAFALAFGLASQKRTADFLNRRWPGHDAEVKEPARTADS